MANRELGLYDTTVGKKAVMAISGVLLLGFVFSHMAGNLLIFKGQAAMDDYAQALRELAGGAGIWVARLGLIAAVVAHIWSAISLSKQNSDARPIKYQRVANNKSTFASRSMFWGGITILLYIVYHIAHLTFGVTAPGEYVEGAVYARVVASFQVPWIVAVYLIAQVCLALHLYHGAWSFMQSLGISHPRFNHYRNAFALGFSAVTSLGFAIVPIAVIAGLVT